MRSSGTTTVRLLSRGRRLLAVFLALSFGAAFVAAVPLPAAAAACDAPVLNEVACENTKTGNPSTEWNITGSGSASIQGFATVASYFAPVGRYSVNENYFSSATTRGPLTALQNGTDGANGVYRYGTSGFPNSSYASSNYWVDVVFTTD